MIDDIPFGNPEGASANLDDLLHHDFVEFDSRNYKSGISADATDLTVRVIVGAKGAGKTAYLRRLHDGLRHQPSIYIDPDIGLDPPPTEQIIRFCSLFPERLLTEKWMGLWRCAILRSLLSHLLYAPRLRDHVQHQSRDALESLTKQARLESRTPEPIFSSARTLLFGCTRPYDFEELSASPVWDAVAFHLSESMHDLPPCCFILDSVDEEFAHAPMHWLRAQKGLFYCVMRLLRNQRLGGRLHIVISVRDHVYSSVLKSEHQNRYRGVPHIRVLDWGWQSITHFLNTKVSRLEPQYVLQSQASSGTPLYRWLGRRSIRNGSRELQEPLEQYLVRHTRQLPRDIVQLGNAIASLTRRARTDGKDSVSDESLRQVIGRCARSFGNEQLTICVNQILSSSIPTEAGRFEYTDLYTGNVEYREDLVSHLKKLIRLIGTDSFSASKLEAAEQYGKKHFGNDSDALSVLWQNRMLGYRKSKGEKKAGDFQEIFYSEHNLDEFRLPRGLPEYFLHPVLIDAVGLNSTVARPLVPGFHSQR